MHLVPERLSVTGTHCERTGGCGSTARSPRSDVEPCTSTVGRAAWPRPTAGLHQEALRVRTLSWGMTVLQ